MKYLVICFLIPIWVSGQSEKSVKKESEKVNGVSWDALIERQFVPTVEELKDFYSIPNDAVNENDILKWGLAWFLTVWVSGFIIVVRCLTWKRDISILMHRASVRFHTIIPAFITKNGKPFISLGVMGGSVQPQIITNIIDFGMNIQEAGDAPRIRHEGSSEPTGSVMKDGGIVNVENGYPFETIRELIGKGHKIGISGTDGYGGYQAIRYDWENKLYYGASESRKDGQAVGY